MMVHKESLLVLRVVTGVLGTYISFKKTEAEYSEGKSDSELAFLCAHILVIDYLSLGQVLLLQYFFLNWQ